MKFECDSCHAQYMIADEKVGKRGVKVKCKRGSDPKEQTLPAASTRQQQMRRPRL